MVLRDHFPPKSSWPWNTLVNTLHNLQPPGLEMLVTSSEISLVWFCSLLSMRVWWLFIEWALTITERDQFLSSQEFGKADILWTKWYLNMYHSVANPLFHLRGHSCRHPIRWMDSIFFTVCLMKKLSGIFYLWVMMGNEWILMSSVGHQLKTGISVEIWS